MLLTLPPYPQQTAVLTGAQVSQTWGQWFRTLGQLLSRITIGSGSPAGVVVADVGSIYLRTDGGASTTLYVKESGSGAATGWAAK